MDSESEGDILESQNGNDGGGPECQSGDDKGGPITSKSLVNPPSP